MSARFATQHFCPKGTIPIIGLNHDKYEKRRLKNVILSGNIQKYFLKNQIIQICMNTKEMGNGCDY